jgi:PKD repeat protein
MRSLLSNSLVAAISEKQRLTVSDIHQNKGYRFGILSILIIGIVPILLLCPMVSAAAPAADFSANPTSGTVPLTVQFNDTSTGSPTGWAWYFGDENFTAPWTQQTADAGWSGRIWPSSVVMPDGSIVLMGGFDGSSLMNDVWQSTDNGVTWTLVNASAEWMIRYRHSSVVMPDGSIVLMGGNAWDGRKNDTWRSTDNGAIWTLVNASSGWTTREGHRSVAMPDGSIVLMGGLAFSDGSSGITNDTWRSTDNGATWTQVTAGAGWSARRDHSSVAMPDGSIVLMGGAATDGLKNDVWRSTDNGATWTQQTASAGWITRESHSSVVMPDGSIVLMGGIDDGANFKNDVWRSTDNGATWTRVTAGAGWTARYRHSSVAMPDGSIVLMGGWIGGYENDVWRSTLTGSSVQNPSHTYTTPGVYQVVLQAFSAGGYNSTRKIGYITVTGSSAPVADFSANVTFGTAPLAVQFYDNSTGTPTSWNWSFGDGSVVNATERNPVHTYVSAGNYTVSLTATNAAGSNTKTVANYITVSSGSETYVFVTKWGTSGAGDGQFNYPSGVAVDSSGILYVADFENHRIQMFSSTGIFLAKWGTAGTVDGQFNYPSGVAVDSSGNVYVADTDNYRIQMFSSTGTFLAKWGSYGSGDGRLLYPSGIAVDSSGNVYVADTSNHRIQMFSSTGTFLAKWGSYGSGDGQFNYPYGIAVDSSGNVYVADEQNHRIQKFSSTGTFLAKWGASGSGDGQFNTPRGVAVDSSGNVYIADEQNHRIQMFSSTGTFLTKWGASGSGDGQFDAPYGVAVDSSGNVYVTDYWNNRIQKFARSSATPPVANFSANVTSGIIPFTVKFNDLSDNVPSSWNWSFGDGTFSVAQNPVHTYLVPGIFSVSLDLSNPGGSNTTIRSGYISVFPKGDFNTNWRVDIGDVTKVAYMAVGLIPKDPNANFNGDTKVDISDASKIAWYYVGKIAIL